MRVRLCARCPYTPRDLAHHYDPEAALYACAKCDTERDECETKWRGTCSTRIITGEARQSVALSVRDNLASSDTIAHEPRSVRKNALIGSGCGATATADGCGGFALPDAACGRNSWRAPFPNTETAL